MSEKRHPFKSEYVEGSQTPAADRVDVKTPTVPLLEQPPFTGEYVKESTQTPSVGKPYGTGKPRRVTIRGKISRD